MLRLGTVVLLSNLAGVFLATALVGISNVFDPAVKEAFTSLGLEVMKPSPRLIFLKGIFAGRLIALMVWLLPAAEATRVRIIIILTYFAALGRFSHIIAGSAETFYVVVTGEISFGTYLFGFMLPALAGNSVGGVSLVAALNHAQVISGRSGAGDDG